MDQLDKEDIDEDLPKSSQRKGDAEINTQSNEKSASNGEPGHFYTGKKPKWWKALSNRRGTKSQRAAISRMTEKGFVIPRIKYQHFINVSELFASSPGSRQLGEEITLKKEEIIHYGPNSNISIVNLELGFGLGDNLLTNAMNFPDHNHIGAEIHRPGVGTVLSRIEKSVDSGQFWREQTLWNESEKDANGDISNHHDANKIFPYGNVRIFPGDGVKLLSHLPPISIDNIYLTFPDPWPEESHSQWRVIQIEVVNLIGKVLKNGGCFYLATDAVCFEEWCVSIFNKVIKLELDQCGQEVWEEIVPCPNRKSWLPVISKYEEKGYHEGRSTMCHCWRRRHNNI
jgi:tRNA G46 methylase TrmB